MYQDHPQLCHVARLRCERGARGISIGPNAGESSMSGQLDTPLRALIRWFGCRNRHGGKRQQEETFKETCHDIHRSAKRNPVALQLATTSAVRNSLKRAPREPA